MTSENTRAFALGDQLSHKRDPRLTAADERHFADIAASLAHAIAEVSEQLDTERKAPAGKGRQAVDRDDAVKQLSARLRALRRFTLDVCLGQMVYADNPDPVYIGRFGLTDSQGRRQLVDWRSPAAEPFFGATHANPMGLISRRRYRWTRGQVTDYWDEVFAADEFDGHAAALDDQSAFIASLGADRSSRMRDVLGTIQADQDAIIRAGSKGALVVDGGPGTGKTVVALHRTAYLLYSDPRLKQGGVLFVGPHNPYLAYVSDVLPSLGEEDVQTCTLRDLVPEGPAAIEHRDRLKESARMVEAVEAAVRFYEEPPRKPTIIETDWAEIPVTTEDWTAAFESVSLGTPHNEARDEIWDELVTILAERHDTDTASLRQNPDLRAAVNRAWPVLDPAELVGDLWSVPAYLRKCAPWLDADEIRSLQREDPAAWTTADLPLLDAARQRLGDPETSARNRRSEAARRSHQREMSIVIDDLIASHTYDDGQGLMTMLRQQDLKDVLVDEAVTETAEADQLAGPFAHIVVDEAQELTDAEWQMLLLRCPSRSFTIVGDRAQARHGFTESWPERLERIGLEHVTVSSLTINYRTPAAIMAAAEPVIRAVLPDANVPTSIRETPAPLVREKVSNLTLILDDWLAAHADGVACVIGVEPAADERERVRVLTPELSKGLEFDLVVLIRPETFGDGVEGAVDRYVAMTRATRQLVILT